MATKIIVRNGNVESALKTLKVDKDGSRRKIRENEYYTKPGVRRRNAKKEGIKNTRRRERSERYNKAA